MLWDTDKSDDEPLLRILIFCFFKIDHTMLAKITQLEIFIALICICIPIILRIADSKNKQKGFRSSISAYIEMERRHILEWSLLLPRCCSYITASSTWMPVFRNKFIKSTFGRNVVTIYFWEWHSSGCCYFPIMSTRRFIIHLLSYFYRMYAGHCVRS